VTSTLALNVKSAAALNINLGELSAVYPPPGYRNQSVFFPAVIVSEWSSAFHCAGLFCQTK
jgi:hypothetical protein